MASSVFLAERIGLGNAGSEMLVMAGNAGVSYWEIRNVWQDRSATAQ